MDDELIQFSSIQKRTNHASTTHHPDIFAGRLPQSTREIIHRFVDKFHWPRLRRRWVVRKHVALDVCTEIPALSFLAESQANVIGISSPDDCVDRTEEFTHAVVAGSSRTVKPIEATIRPGNVAISTRGDMNDDLALVHVLLHYLKID